MKQGSAISQRVVSRFQLQSNWITDLLKGDPKHDKAYSKLSDIHADLSDMRSEALGVESLLKKIRDMGSAKLAFKEATYVLKKYHNLKSLEKKVSKLFGRNPPREVADAFKRVQSTFEKIPRPQEDLSERVLAMNADEFHKSLRGDINRESGQVASLWQDFATACAYLGNLCSTASKELWAAR